MSTWSLISYIRYDSRSSCYSRYILFLKLCVSLFSVFVFLFLDYLFVSHSSFSISSLNAIVVNLCLCFFEEASTVKKGIFDALFWRVVSFLVYTLIFHLRHDAFLSPFQSTKLMCMISAQFDIKINKFVLFFFIYYAQRLFRFTFVSSHTFFFAVFSLFRIGFRFEVFFLWFSLFLFRSVESIYISLHRPI